MTGKMTVSDCLPLCVFQREKVQYPKLAFSVEDLRQRFKQQLDMEGASTVTINSVEALKPVTPHMAKMVSILWRLPNV